MPVFLLLTLLPVPGFYHGYSVTDREMEPVIPYGGFVVAWKSGGYQPGDSIVLQDGLGVRTARVIAIPSNERILVKGDAGHSRAKLIQTSSVLGTILFRLPYFGYVVEFIRTVPGAVILIVAPALTVLIVGIRAFRPN
ncbi:MAG: S24/S26 family peptidase [Actinobacteria bacterium]|nr:S24/S26 family peptidase [Actinomycetota bacterium]